jgi:amidase
MKRLLKYFNFFVNKLAAVCGNPSVNVPIGFVHGMPVGLVFLGTAFQEGPLIGLAYAYEQATNHRREPKFASTVS